MDANRRKPTKKDENGNLPAPRGFVKRGRLAIVSVIVAPILISAAAPLTAGL